MENVTFPEDTARLLLVAYHPPPKRYIGGGRRFLEAVLALNTRSLSVDYILLEPTPTLMSHAGLSYKSSSYSPSLFHDKILYDGRISPAIAIEVTTSIVKAILKGVRDVKKLNLHAVVSMTEDTQNVVPAYIISKLTNRDCVVCLHNLPIYAFNSRFIRYRSFSLKSAMVYAKEEQRLTPNRIIYMLFKWLVYLMCRNSICIVNPPLHNALVNTGGFRRVYSLVMPGVRIQNGSQCKTKLYDGLFVAANISEGKGILDLLHAWKIILSERPDMKLAIAGRASNKIVGKISRTLDDLGIRSSVAFPLGLNGADHEKIFDLMKVSKIFIYPSRHDTTAGVVQEALALGLPVVMYEGYYAAAVYDESEFLRMVPTGDIDALADAFLSLTEEYSLQLSQRASAYSSKFDSQVLGAKLFNLIRSSVKVCSKNVKGIHIDRSMKKRGI